MRHSLKYVAQEDRLEFMGKLVRCGMKKYRVIARRPFGADAAISRYNDAIRNAGMSKVSTKMCPCLQHFR